MNSPVTATGSGKLFFKIYARSGVLLCCRVNNPPDEQDSLGLIVLYQEQEWVIGAEFRNGVFPKQQHSFS